MKAFLRSAGIALGATSIYLLWWVAPLLSPTHEMIYHWSGRPSALFVPVFVDFVAAWLILALLFMLARRSERMHVAIWMGILLFTPWMIVKNWSILSGVTVSYLLTRGLFVTALVLFVLLLAFWRPSFEKKLERVAGFAATLFVFAAISGVAILCELAWLGWQARGLNAAMPLHHAQHVRSTEAAKPRVIWILFDELSYRQLYGHRFPGLQLPAFDQLAAQATVFTHVIPAGIRTEQVMPALMTGEPVDAIRSSRNGMLSTHNPKTKTWQRFNAQDTVFQDALNANYSTAVAGWFNPYCRILPGVLDHCFWTFDSLTQNGLMPGATLRWNLLASARFAADSLVPRFASLLLPVSEIGVVDTEMHISDYKSLSEAADQVLDDRSASFALLHMPIPHPGGIYDRTIGKFASSHSSYLDNLALADRCLSHIHTRLEQSGEWDSATIVVMGDHSWRAQLLWRSLPSWTREEEIASHGGQFDDRPAYIVKLPHQHIGARFDAPFSALNTRRLLDALLNHNISSAKELSIWAQRERGSM